MQSDNKTMALAKFLEIDPALIENNYGEYYTVNQRTIKSGKTPEQFQKLADDFRTLLSDEHIELVTDAILNPNKKMKFKKKIKDCGKIETVEETVELSEYAYSVVSKALDSMKAPAEKRKKQLERLNAGEWKPPVKETPLDIYARLDKEHFYVVNVLYHLVKAEDDYNRDYVNSLKRAWLGQPVSDTREDRIIDDGEYLVLTDSEAEKFEKEHLEQLFDEIADIPSYLSNYVNKEKWIDDSTGERGQNLATYDGEEYDIEFEGETYYIYRTN